jgi:hypothetical protein
MKSILTCLLVYVSIVSFAQERSDHKKFGFKVGVNHSHMNYQRGYRPAGQLAPASKPMTGLTAGLVLNLPVTHNISIQPEYLYASRKTFLTASGVTNHFQYLSLPVFLQLKLSEKIFLLGGPQFDLLIHATTNDGKQSVEITHDVEERNLGATGGIQYFFSNKFFIDARYMHGISNVGVGQRSSVQEFKYQSFELTAGIRF